MEAIERTSTIEDLWDLLINDDRVIHLLIDSLSEHNPPDFSLYAWNNHLRELIPPKRTNGLNMHFIKLFLQDLWPSENDVKKIKDALKENFEAINNPALRILSQIRETLHDKDLILSGGPFLDYYSQLFTSISEKIKYLD